MTKQDALDRASAMMLKAEDSMGETALSKYLTLAQVYMSLAHELSD